MLPLDPGFAVRIDLDCNVIGWQQTGQSST
jgi:hypothetical protein